MSERDKITGGITAPAGFTAAGVACGIKPSGLDLAMIVSTPAARAAGIFTTNLVNGPFQGDRHLCGIHHVDIVSAFDPFHGSGLIVCVIVVITDSRSAVPSLTDGIHNLGVTRIGRYGR